MKWLAVIFFIILISGGGAIVYQKTRGLRNNNPGNIRKGIDWQGMSATQTDSAFIQFDDPVMGIRAMNKILKTYYIKYGLNTVRGIINRWAPPNENNTDSYVNAVAARLGVGPDEVIDVPARAVELSQAIIKHENGSQPYDVATIERGAAMAWA